MRRIVICSLSGSTICFHVLPQRNTVMYQGFAGVHGVAVTFYLFASLRGADPPCCRFSSTLSSTSCSLLLVSLHATISWLSSSQRAQKHVRTFSSAVTCTFLCALENRQQRGSARAANRTGRTLRQHRAHLRIPDTRRYVAAERSSLDAP